MTRATSASTLPPSLRPQRGRPTNKATLGTLRAAREDMVNGGSRLGHLCSADLSSDNMRSLKEAEALLAKARSIVVSLIGKVMASDVQDADPADADDED